MAVRDARLIRRYIRDLTNLTDQRGSFTGTLEELLGGPLSRETLKRYQNKLDVPMPRLYDGRTTCVHILTGDGYDIVLDAGSGFRNCAQDLQERWGDREHRKLFLFMSHAHFDHIEGFDQAEVCFDQRNDVEIYGPREVMRVLDSNLGIFSKRSTDDQVISVITPLTFHSMPTAFEGIEIRDPENTEEAAWRTWDLNRPIEIGKTRITPFPVYHSCPCLAYKIEHGGKVFIYCTDHELRHGGDSDDLRQKHSEEAEARLREHSQGADVLYRDAQYFRAEYAGEKGIGTSAAAGRRDWGHSCIEDVLQMSLECGVRHTLLGHHDPNRGWAERNEVDNDLMQISRQREGTVELARADTVIYL